MAFGIGLGPAVENQAAYATAQITFHAAFFDYLEKAGPDPLEELLMEVPSNTAVEEHIFLGDIPGFREWVGDREMGTLQGHGITVKNRDFSSGVSVHRNQIMDDKLGLVMPRIMGLADKAKKHRGQLAAELLLNGFAGNFNFGSVGDQSGASGPAGDGTTYDGAFMFSASHQLEGGIVQSNLLNSVALSDSGLEQAIQLMRGFRTYDGKVPLYTSPTHLVVGPKLEWMAKRLRDQEMRVRNTGDGGTVVAAADTNIHKGTFDILMSPWLMDFTALGGADYSKSWFLVDLSKPIRPFIFQNREPISAASQVDWSSPDMFKKGQMNFGAQARYAVSNYDWRLAVGSLGS